MFFVKYINAQGKHITMDFKTQMHAKEVFDIIEQWALDTGIDTQITLGVYTDEEAENVH